MMQAEHLKRFIHSYSVCGMYQVTHRIGAGSTGNIMGAFNILTGTEVAIKKEARIELPKMIAGLQYEAMIYKFIPEGTEGFVPIHYAGPDANHYVLVMDMLGPNLDSLRRVCRGHFSLRTICMLADQMLSRLEFLHSRGVVCCDVKPHNFAMGLRRNVKIVYLFDFQFAKPYLDPDCGDHVGASTGRHSLGTTRYASVAAHDGQGVTRRDDIESLLYVLLEFYHGTLPWRDLPAQDYLTWMKCIRDMKADMSSAGPFQSFLACSPPEFAVYHAYCVRLMYGQEPDYAVLRELFQDRMRKEGWKYDWTFDWEDGSSLRQGTLLPEEYVASMDFVDEKEWNPNYM